MSSAQSAIKLCPCPATSNSIQLEWISSISRTASFVSSSIHWTWIADAPIVLQGPHLRRTELADDVCYMLNLLYIFSGGEQDTVAEPDSTLIFDKFGNLYGTTQWGARSARIDALGGW